MTLLDRMASLLAEREPELLLQVFARWDRRLLDHYRAAEQDCFPAELLYSEEELLEREKKEEFAAMLAFRNNRPAAVLLICADEDRDILYLDTLAVLNRGEGLGRRLVKALIEAASAEGKKGISLDTERINSKGQKLVDFYQDLGFSIYESQCSGDNIHMVLLFKER